MDNITYILYLCQALPMILALALMRGRSRLVMGYVIIGATIGLISSELNGTLYDLIGSEDMLYFCTTVSPVTEEILKGLPILFYAFFISDDVKTLVPISFATGLGFAILENLFIMMQNLSEIGVLWAFFRGIGAALMHGVCTAVVGMGIAFVRKQRKLLVVGTIALLIMAMTYHGLYNSIIMSDYKYIGFLLPMCTYIPINIVFIRRLKAQKKLSKER